MKRIVSTRFTVLLLRFGGKTMEHDQKISQEEARERMEAGDVIVLDVREQEEYDSGHIPGAVLLPLGAIDGESAAEVIPEKDAAVLVYCRSGSRSKRAAKALAELGYTGVYEFGGIMTWPYDVVK
ncbi:MAG TPA: rhodanese-like domain-containing protein [Candidatus Faecalibacterium avium]|nr:rhodanese-like domain-containing protein [Candidatus Faecalibacterium avium]